MPDDLLQPVAAMDDESGCLQVSRRAGRHGQPAREVGARFDGRQRLARIGRGVGDRGRRDRAGWSRRGRTGRDRPAAAGRGRERSFAPGRLMPLRLALRSASCGQRRLQLDADDAAAGQRAPPGRGRRRRRRRRDRARAGRARHRRRPPAARRRWRRDSRGAGCSSRTRPPSRASSVRVRSIYGDHVTTSCRNNPHKLGRTILTAWQQSFPSRASARRPAWSRCWRSAPTTWRRSIARSWRACARRWR